MSTATIADVKICDAFRVRVNNPYLIERSPWSVWLDRAEAEAQMRRLIGSASSDLGFPIPETDFAVEPVNLLVGSVETDADGNKVCDLKVFWQEDRGEAYRESGFETNIRTDNWRIGRIAMNPQGDVFPYDDKDSIMTDSAFLRENILCANFEAEDGGYGAAFVDGDKVLELVGDTLKAA